MHAKTNIEHNSGGIKKEKFEKINKISKIFSTKKLENLKYSFSSISKCSLDVTSKASSFKILCLLLKKNEILRKNEIFKILKNSF